MPKIEWGSPYFRFELSCTDQAVAECAGDVFEPWRAGRSAIALEPWLIDPHQGSWRIEGPALPPTELELPDRFKTYQEAIKAVEFRSAWLSLVHPNAPVGFHGALLSKKGNAVGIIGGKEAGKSTLAVALWRAGFHLHSDDGLQLSPGAREVTPLTRRVRLRPGSRPLFEDPLWGELRSQKACFEDSDGSLLFQAQRALAPPKRLKALILLRSEPGEWEPLEESQAAMELIVHTHRYYSQGLPKTLAEVTSLVNDIPVYKLGRDTLSSRIEQIEANLL